MTDDQEPADSLQQSIEDRERKIEEERQVLLTRVGSSDVSTLRHRVAWLLNRYPSTRNSDIALQLKHWETFEGETFHGSYISAEDYSSFNSTYIHSEGTRENSESIQAVSCRPRSS